VASTNVYIVLCNTPSDDYGYGRNRDICSVHRTLEAAKLACQNNRVKELEKELKAVKEDLHYRPELRDFWTVEELKLED